MIMMSIWGCKNIKIVRKTYTNRLPLIPIFPVSIRPNFTELSGEDRKMEMSSTDLRFPGTSQEGNKKALTDQRNMASAP